MTTTTYSSQLNVLKTYVSAMTLATLLGLTLLGCESSFEAPRDEARFTAYESAKRNVTPEALVALFRQWKRTTSEGGMILNWSGATSELLWIQYRPAWRPRFGDGGPESWIVWARSPGGRYFQVEFWLDVTRGLYVLDGPRATSLDDLVATLTDGGHTAVIDKLKLPRKSA